MDRRSMAACGLALVCFWNLGGTVFSEEPGGAIRWHKDLQAAHRESVRLNRPVLIVFGAPWCHYCTKLEQESLGHPQVARYINNTFVPVHLNFDEAGREAKILDIKAVPCVVALTPKAELVGRLDGFASAQKVADMLVDATKLQAQLQKARIQQARYQQVGRQNAMSSR